MTGMWIGRRQWLPTRRLARRSRGLVLGGLWLRVVTWTRATTLDRELANGADPMQSDELSLRTGQLRSAGTRSRLAGTLRQAVDVANGRHPPLITTRLRRQQIRDNAELLLTLAQRLSGDVPLGAQGVAMTARLVTDRSGPLYRNERRRPLSVAASEALTALDCGDRQRL
jgi:hypothetical protein